MARQRKSGRKDTGIQAKKGYLYIVLSHNTIRDGHKYNEKKWIATGLPDTAENVVKAAELRARILRNNSIGTLNFNATMSDYVDTFLALKEREIADTTYAKYMYNSLHIKAYFGNLKVKEITPKLIEDFFDSLHAKGLKNQTISGIRILAKSILEFAVKEGIIIYNPAKEVKSRQTVTDENAEAQSEAFFTEDECKKFLATSKKYVVEKAKKEMPDDTDFYFNLYAMMYFSLIFCLRREEVLGLRWSAIDFNRKTMRINHTCTKGQKINRLNRTKSDASLRDFPLTDQQIAILNRIKKQEKANRHLFRNGYHDSDYVFKHADGTLFYPDYPTKLFTKIRSSAPELPQNVTFHGLRKSGISLLVHAGYDVKSIQKWAGHADINTTLQIYASIRDQEAKKELLDGMNELLPPDLT